MSKPEKGERRDYRQQVPLSPSERRAFQEAAQRLGMPVAVWLRALGLDAVRGQHTKSQRKARKKAPRKGREEG